MEILGPKVFICRCVVQCKRYSGRVSRQRLYEDILKASEHSPDYFILATTGIVGASTKDWLASKQDKLGMKVVLWERTDLDILLGRHQDLRARFLNIPIDPDYLLRRISQEADALSRADKLLLTPIVSKAFTVACALAMKYSNVATVGHILVSLLREDRDCTRSVFIQRDINPDKLALQLEQALVRTRTEPLASRGGLQLSVSFRLAVETGLRIMGTLREGVLSERILLWSALIQPFSGTLRFLEKKCRVNVNELLGTLTSQFFDEAEVKSVFRHILLPSDLLREN